MKVYIVVASPVDESWNVGVYSDRETAEKAADEYEYFAEVEEWEVQYKELEVKND